MGNVTRNLIERQQRETVTLVVELECGAIYSETCATFKFDEKKKSLMMKKKFPYSHTVRMAGIVKSVRRSSNMFSHPDGQKETSGK